MTVDVTLWQETFAQDRFPPFRCPTCQKGTLALIKDGLKVIESGRSKLAKSHDAWEPDWTDERFCGFLACSDTTCGELVIVSGDTVVVEEEDEEFGRHWESHLRPRSMFPAPHIIELVQEVPSAVKRELEQSFQLFWADLNAAANRIRTSLERALDEIGVKKYNKTGKRVSLALATRISEFEKQHGNEFSAIFTALRHVGNLGTHANVSRLALLTAYEVYEHALSELFGKRKKKIAALSKKLVKSKGKMK
jgi:uncharacterized protein DUF4145